MIRVAPKPRDMKKAHSWETPRSFGLTAASASAVASLAAVARSPTASLAAEARSPIASRAAVAFSPIRSAPLRSSSMPRRLPRSSCRYCGLVTIRRAVAPAREAFICDFGHFFRPASERSCSVTAESRLDRSILMSKTALASPKNGLQGLSIQRRLSTPGVHPFDQVEWEIRDAVIGDPASPAFEQRGVEFPVTWSQNATNIVAQKYFRGQMGSPERESSVKQMIGRVAGTIAGWGREGGYFASEEDADAFEMELTAILLNQKAAFNSPVWFNVGFEEHPQCSACFILSVEDTMESIVDWNTKEGMIFRGGSGSGINLSNIRGSMEQLSKGGLASGPVSFMRGADAWAGTIKSGGKTRRAAKMVVLDIDHPDVVDFIWCKANEELKAAALRDAGFDMRLDSDAFASIQYQNANNSVRVTDEFMRAVDRGGKWHTLARTTGQPVEEYDARDLMRQIADASWRCADPGVQYDTIINEWHTCPNSGRINASNPCSEYMHVDDSACNLASINLLKFRRPDGTFDTEAFEHVVDVVLLAQEIVVGPSSYPTEGIGVNARAFRQLGLGYANLGAYLMAGGMPYDSDAARGTAAAITALMTGRAYRQSAHAGAAVGQSSLRG